jgi:cell division protein ZapA (FtsZ GTPase activity inhibitor)
LKETALACDAFVKALTRALEKKVSLLNRKLAQLANDKREEARWVTDRIADDRLFVIEGLCCVDSLSRSKGDIQNTAQAALRIMHDYAVHPWSVHDELSALLDALNSKPTAATVAAEASLETARRAKQAVQRAWKTGFRAE